MQRGALLHRPKVGSPESTLRHAQCGNAQSAQSGHGEIRGVFFRYTHHRVLCTSADQESFLEAHDSEERGYSQLDTARDPPSYFSSGRPSTHSRTVPRSLAANGCFCSYRISYANLIHPVWQRLRLIGRRPSARTGNNRKHVVGEHVAIPAVRTGRGCFDLLRGAERSDIGNSGNSGKSLEQSKALHTSSLKQRSATARLHGLGTGTSRPPPPAGPQAHAMHARADAT